MTSRVAECCGTSYGVDNPAPCVSRTSSAPRSSALPYLITSTRAARRGSSVARLPGLAPAVAESLMVCACTFSPPLLPLTSAAPAQQGCLGSRGGARLPLSPRRLWVELGPPGSPSSCTRRAP